MDKPARTSVSDYIEKAIEDSKKEGEEETTAKSANTSSNGEQVCISEVFACFSD